MLRWWIETHSFKHGRTRSWLAVNFQIFARTYQTLSSEVASLTSQNILKICHIFQNVRSCSSRALSENSDTKADSSEGRRMRARSTSSLNCNPHMLLLLLLLLTPNEVLNKTENRILLSISGLGPSTNEKVLEKKENLGISKTQTKS